MRLKKLFSYIFIATVFGFLFFNIGKSWSELKVTLFIVKKENILPIAISFLLLYPVNSIAWHFVTQALGLKTAILKNIKLWMLSNSARFLPGGFWQYAFRIYLGKESGFGTALAASAVLVESLFTLAVGSLIILLIFTFGRLPGSFSFPLYILGILIFLPALFSLLTRPKILQKVLRIMARFSKKKITIAEINLPSRWILPLGLLFSLEFFLPGTILFFLTRSFTELSLTLYPVFIGIFAASFLAGYVVFFVPSGLGIQEASIAGLLSLFISFPLAAAIAVVFRFIMLLSEAWFLIMVLVFTRRTQIKYNQP